jgi:hypothetical protein
VLLHATEHDHPLDTNDTAATATASINNGIG